MGVHFGRKGAVLHRVHHVTRHRVFAGPATQVGQPSTQSPCAALNRPTPHLPHPTTNPAPTTHHHPVQVCTDVADAANGGQILLTADAWEELAKSMAAAGWPVVQLIGFYAVRGRGRGSLEAIWTAASSR
jgi:hypothetical protein